MFHSKKILSKYILADGFDIDLDLEKSHGSYLVDKGSGKRYLDFFTCFASMPIGYNHPKIMENSFLEKLKVAAINKPSNSDLYSYEYAQFVDKFFELAVTDHFKYSFFIDGGTLAIENALKIAFDWKVRKNFAKGYKFERGSKVIHFKEAFHGRSGYTISLTNTDPVKTDYFPKFDWPRVTNPKLSFPIDEKALEEVIRLENQSVNEIKEAFLKYPDDIAAIIIEPIQGEGGDNHFRNEFLQELRIIADENEALLIFDEVQTGVGLTGKMWAHQSIGVLPDIMAFGKKMQVCGLICSDRVDDIQDNVFHHSSRINSTWGGNLTDMVRIQKYLEIIHEDKYIDNVNNLAPYLSEKLANLVSIYPDYVSNPRNRGFFAAFDLKPELRNPARANMMENGLIMLSSGHKSIRFRPPLNLSKQEIEEGFDIISLSIKTAIDNSLRKTS